MGIAVAPGAGKLEELAGGREYDESHLDIAENGQLMCLLDEPSSPFGEGHLPGCGVVDPLDLDLLPCHLNLFALFLLYNTCRKQTQQTKKTHLNLLRSLQFISSRRPVKGRYAVEAMISSNEYREECNSRTSIDSCFPSF